ncbi:PKD domain-containing protein [Methanosarcina sp. Mfa9]|uniref:cohesin domain-containing protein n=1 Tax=Methanosarcina sp. Mfa9 TaxID=3439063 RepID=UPI003F831BCF
MLLAAASPAQADVDPFCSLVSEPNVTSVEPGDVFTVTVSIDPHSVEVYGLQYNVSFDPDAFEVMSQSPGPFLSQDGQSTFIIPQIGNEIGEVLYAEVRYGTKTGVSEPGIVSTIEFKVKDQVSSHGVKEFALNEVLIVEIVDSEQQTAGYDFTNGAVVLLSSSVSNFTANVTEGEAPLTVGFTDASKNAVSWSWDFDGDGLVDSKVRNPEYTYTAPGEYTVSLTVANELGTIDTIAESITVYGIPTACFTASVVEGDTPLTVGFTDASTNSVSWSWDFNGDGLVDSKVQNPEYTYSAPGEYIVSLTAENELGTSDTVTETITVYGVPVAHFTVNVTEGEVPFTVGFADTSTNAVSWSWDFNGDGAVDSEIRNPKYTYTEPGEYIVSLTVANELGTIDTIAETITVYGVPVSDFTANITEGEVPFTVLFTDASTNAVSWSWDFDGDGLVDSDFRNPEFKYTEPGTYSVSLTVENELGTSDTVTETITVYGVPAADFTSNVVEGDSPLTVVFTDSSTNAVSWSWDFDGDGEVDSNIQNPEYTYTEPGEYTVSLNVTNELGTIDTSRESITIYGIPVAGFTASVVEGENPLTVKFTDTSMNAVSWSWDFDGDGSVDSNVRNPEYTYTESGKYAVSLTVENEPGTIDTATQTIKVKSSQVPEPPVINSVDLFPASTTPGSTLDVSVDVTGKVGVIEVTAGDVSLAKKDGIWKGSITVPYDLGDYSLSIIARDAVGNTAITSAPYHVVRAEGGADITVSPRASNVVAGNSVSTGIKVKNTQNIDDVFKIRINVDGVPASYLADLSGFEWTEKDVKLRAGEENIFPLEVEVPAGTAPGYRLFKANIDSEASAVYGFDTGYLIVS